MGADRSDTFGVLERPQTELRPAEFVTAFHCGAGGSRVVLLADRIVTHYRSGRTSEILFREIAYAGTCRTGLRQPAHGVYLVLRTPPYDTGYLFEHAATCRDFFAILQQRICGGTDAVAPPDPGRDELIVAQSVPNPTSFPLPEPLLEHSLAGI